MESRTCDCEAEPCVQPHNINDEPCPNEGTHMTLYTLECRECWLQKPNDLRKNSYIRKGL